MSGARVRTRWWFMLPITLHIVGGLIMYYVVRGDDPAKARDGLHLGAALTAVELAATAAVIAFFALAGEEPTVGDIIRTAVVPGVAPA